MKIGRFRPSHVVAAIRHRPSKVPHLNENGRTASCITTAQLHSAHLLFQEMCTIGVHTKVWWLCIQTAHSRDLRESEVLGHGALLLAIRAIFCPPTIGGSPKIWTAKTFCPTNANKWRNPPFGFQILKNIPYIKLCIQSFWPTKVDCCWSKRFEIFQPPVQCHLPKRSKVELWKGVSSLSNFSNKQMSCYIK